MRDSLGEGDRESQIVARHLDVFSWPSGHVSAKPSTNQHFSSQQPRGPIEVIHNREDKIAAGQF